MALTVDDSLHQTATSIMGFNVTASEARRCLAPAVAVPNYLVPVRTSFDEYSYLLPPTPALSKQEKIARWGDYYTNTKAGATLNPLNNVALVAADSTAMATQDTWFQSLLITDGNAVTPFSDNVAEASITNQFGLIVFTTSADPAVVANKWVNSTIPVMICNGLLAGMFKLSTDDPSVTGPGTTSTFKVPVPPPSWQVVPPPWIHVTGGSKPWCVGGVGTAVRYQQLANIEASTAIQIMTDITNPNYETWVFEKGTLMSGMTAPARRCYFSITNETIDKPPSPEVITIFKDLVKWLKGT